MTLRPLVLCGLVTVALSACGGAAASAGIGALANQGSPSTAAPAATAAATPGLIQCTFQITDPTGKSLVERYSGYGIRWFQTDQQFPQTCQGIQQSLEGGNDTVGAAQTPPGAPMCSHNGWSVWPSGNPALARTLCAEFAGRK